MVSSPHPESVDPTVRSEPETEPWFSYACPVCGHRDGASVDVGSPRRVSCGHCETVLELSAISSAQEQASARVVVDGAGESAH